MTPRVVTARKEARPDQRPDPGGAWRVLAVVALVMGAIGAVDVTLLWIPAEFGSVEWEFGTISAMVDALPLMTLGVLGAGLAGVASGNRGLMRVMAVVAGLVALALVAAAVLYALGLPVAWRGVEPSMRRVLLKAVAKTVGAGILYVALYSYWAGVLWRRSAVRT